MVKSSKKKQTLIGCLIVSKRVNRDVSRTRDGFPKRASKYLYEEKIWIPFKFHFEHEIELNETYFPAKEVVVLAE